MPNNMEKQKMQNNDHYYKMRCAQLNEIKKRLEAEINALNEELASQAISQGIPQASSQQGSKKGKPSRKQSIESPVKMQHGLAHSGIAAEAQEDILKSYSDNPETAQQEVANDASWQSVNSAIGNYMTHQVAKLAQSQHMA